MKRFWVIGMLVTNDRLARFACVESMRVASGRASAAAPSARRGIDEGLGKPPAMTWRQTGWQKEGAALAAAQ